MILEDNNHVLENMLPHLDTEVKLYRLLPGGGHTVDGIAYRTGDTWAVRIRAATGFPVVERHVASKRGAVLALWHHRKRTPSYGD